MGLFDRLCRKEKRMRPYCAVIVAAAGSATRMAGQDKMLSYLGDWPVLVHALKSLEGSSLIDEIVVVTRGDLIVPVGQLCRDFALPKVRKVIVGGDTRSRSVLAGIREVSEEARLIAIHDGARPLTPPEVIDEVILRAAECGAAVPVVPIKDTIKRACGNFVETTLERGALFAVQTPQVFDADLLLGALQKAEDEGADLTDDAAAVERMGMKVALTRGCDENLKITTVTDLIVAESILQSRESGCGSL